MAEAQEFYERPIDRTPYQAFWYLGAGLLALFVLLTYALFAISNTVRHVRLPAYSTPNPKTMFNSAQQSVNNKTQEAADQAANKAADSTTSKLNQLLHP